jgi:putative hydrolase of the HAD superfamily
LSRLAAVVFDLDDTLFPERDYVLSGFRAVAEWAQGRLGIAADRGFEELRHLYEEGVRGQTFGRWLAQRGTLESGLVEQLVAVYREHEPRIAAFPDLLGLIRSLRGRCRLGIVSDGHLAVQRKKVGALGISDLFDTVVLSDEWGHGAWKPSTRAFEEVLSRLDVAAADAIYVADNPVKDFIGAREAGMRTVWLRRAGGEYSGLRCPSAAHVPDWTVETTDDLRALLAEKGAFDR